MEFLYFESRNQETFLLLIRIENVRYLTFFVCTLFCIVTFAQNPALNERILDAAVCKMNIKVGNGICWQFVHKVLQESSATISTPLENGVVQPGDIFYTLGFYQFSGTDDNTMVEGLDAHIAIVYKVLGNNRYMIINQNSQRKRRYSKVVITTIDLNQDFNTVSRGFWFFRPEEGSVFTHDLTHIYKKLPIFQASVK